MSIYNAIANHGKDVGAGLNAFAQGRYRVAQDQRANAIQDENRAYERSRNVLADQKNQQQYTDRMKRQRFEDAVKMAAGGASDEQLTAWLAEVDPDIEPHIIPAIRSMAQGSQSAQKAPTTRTRPVKGGMQVTEEWDGSKWSPVGESERWNPGGGVTVNVNPEPQKEPLTKPNQSKVQMKIIDAEKSLRDLNRVKDTYSDEFLTTAGRVKATLGAVADKWLNSDPGGLASFNADRGAFASNVKQFFNQYRKEITGAAASERELQQLVESLFSEDLGPREFKSRFDEFWDKAQTNLEANKEAAREGVDVGGSNTVSWGDL